MSKAVKLLILPFMLIIFGIFQAGCMRHVTVLNFTGKGLGVTSGNLMQNYSFTETDTDIYFHITPYIYRMNKATKTAIINCSDSGCRHNNINCAAVAEPWIPLQAFDNAIYIIDPDVYDVFYTIENGVKQVAGTLKRDKSIKYYSSLIYNDKIYTFTDRIVLEVSELESNDLIAVYPDCHLFIHGYFIEDDIIYFINQNLELIAINIDGSNRRTLEGNKASYLMSYQNRLYFIQRGDTPVLVSMDKSGNNRISIAEGIENYNIIDSKIFYTNITNKNFYMMDLDGENQQMIDIAALGEDVTGADIYSIGVFPQWGKVVVTLMNRDALILMSADGSDMQLIKVKHPPHG